MILAAPLQVQAAEKMRSFDMNPAGITQMVKEEKPPVKLTLDGFLMNFARNNPIVKDGVTLVPLGTFAAMGWKSDFLESNNAVRIFKDGKTIFAPVDKDVAMISDKGMNRLASLDANTQIIEDEVYVPMSMIAETGADAKWDGANRTIKVDTRVSELADIMSV